VIKIGTLVLLAIGIALLYAALRSESVVVRLVVILGTFVASLVFDALPGGSSR
jgi:hypothetical protein